MQLLQKDNKHFSEHANNDTIIYRNLLAFTENIQKGPLPMPNHINNNQHVNCIVYIQYVCRY